MKTPYDELFTDLTRLAASRHANPNPKGAHNVPVSSRSAPNEARSRESGSGEPDLVGALLQALDEKYALSRKLGQEPGLKDILSQLVGRLYAAYPDLAAVKGKRILDIACGSSTSKAPSFVFVNTPLALRPFGVGERRIPIPGKDGYTAQFEPWFCRILLELGADPVGVDRGDLSHETFEHYPVDLGQPGALDFLPEHSFDAVQDSRLFGSPEFTAQFPRQADRLGVAAEIWRQELRLLKPDGIVIHSDAAQLIQ